MNDLSPHWYKNVGTTSFSFVKNHAFDRWTDSRQISRG